MLYTRLSIVSMQLFYVRCRKVNMKIHFYVFWFDFLISLFCLAIYVTVAVRIFGHVILFFFYLVRFGYNSQYKL